MIGNPYRQRDLPLFPVPAPAPPKAVPQVLVPRFEFLADGPECQPRTLEEIPEWLRFPGEHGHVEMDRFMRTVDRRP